MVSKQVLLTGGTGFVGSHLILELLMQTDYQVVAIVRSRKGEDTQQRLLDVLTTVIEGGQYPQNLLVQVQQRCRVVTGDLTGDVHALVSQIGNIDEFWHSAASLNYEERFADEIMAINVEGTRKALDLAQQLHVKAFNYISTAYVAGRTSGVILEDKTGNVESSNIYEVSKVAAERLIEAASGFVTRIFRPSIVIGHSKTYHAINFSGLYGFQRRVVQFKGMISRVQRGYLDKEPIRMRIDPEVPLNLVPVDVVARQAVKIACNTCESGYFHLTNPNVPTVKEALEVIFTSAGINPPKFVESEDEYNWIDTKFNEKIDFYNSYLRGHKDFDRAQTDQHVDESHETFAIDKAKLQQYCDWYNEQLNISRKQLPQSR